MEFKDSIRIFDDAFTKEECLRLIESHTNAINLGAAWEGGYGELAQHKKSVDWDIIKGDNDNDRELTNLVANRFNEHHLRYLRYFSPWAEFDTSSVIMNQTYYPVFQIQKYQKEEGHFNTWHLENYNKDTSNRLFVFILYLNDVEEGGETAFYFKEKDEADYFKVKPKQGRLIIHPAAWPYVHKGCMPISDNKIILTSWCCYTN